MLLVLATFPYSVVHEARFRILFIFVLYNFCVVRFHLTLELRINIRSGKIIDYRCGDEKKKLLCWGAILVSLLI